MIQFVFVIGATGYVGKELVSQIISKQDDDPHTHANPTLIVGLASRKEYLFFPHGIQHEQAIGFSKRSVAGAPYSSLNEILKKIQEDPSDFPGKGNRLIFIDVTASNLLDFHKNVLKSRRWGVVTANKIPLAESDYKTFAMLTTNVHRYGYRCSVMAGADVINLLQDFRDVHDPVHEIYGCFSGTLGYICTELEKGKRFSEIVKDAWEQGFTEPHPREDLAGVDVARKLLILGRTAGFDVGKEEILIEPFIPQEFLREDNPEAFLKSIQALDGHFLKKANDLASKRKVLRYVGRLTIESGLPRMRVSIEEANKDDDLGSLKGRDNKVIIVTNNYPKERPYRVEVPGAGLAITAQNIRRDLLYLLENRVIRRSAT